MLKYVYMPVGRSEPKGMSERERRGRGRQGEREDEEEPSRNETGEAIRPAIFDAFEIQQRRRPIQTTANLV